MRGNPMMRTRMPALTIIALLGFCIQANAQAPCPELTRLRSEAQEALKQSMTVPASERCYMYIRLSVAWGAVAQYANDNRESCHISIPSLNEFEQYHREAVKDRDNVCVRVLALTMGPFLRGAQETCIAKLNAELLRSLMKDAPQKTRIHLIHLDGELPAEFMTEMAALKIPYYSAPANIAATSQVLGVTADRHNDGHPKAGLNAVYAYMIYKMLRSPPSVVPSTGAFSQPLRAN
jgi:hypothetical protein